MNSRLKSSRPLSPVPWLPPLVSANAGRSPSSPHHPAPASPDAPSSAGRSVLDALLLAVASLILAAAGTAIDGWPIPRVFDEFSYLLSGETFADGRLTNPRHPLPRFFETIHVLQEPTYSSKYFPGHGLFLALGLVLGGSARLGQWLAFAFMGGALAWMLLGWTTRRHALAGAALAVFFLADTNWATGYWGASAAVGGSALLFGALPRLWRGATVPVAIILGIGVVILALSRPFEGLAVSIVPALAMLAWIVRDRTERRRRVTQVALPCVALVAAGGAFLAAHNRATTGDPWRPAYLAYESSAPGAPPFVWQAPVASAADASTLRPPMRARIRLDMAVYRRLRAAPVAEWWNRLTMSARFYLSKEPLLILLALPLAALGDRARRQAALAVACVASATAVSSFFLPSYVGPALPPLLMLTVVGAGVVARRGPWPRRAMQAMVAALVVVGAWRFVTDDRDEAESRRPSQWEHQRAAIAAQVASAPGGALIFVSYADDYRSQHEFVQNGADLYGAPVLWVHDLGGKENAKLIAMYPRRTLWSLRVGPNRRGSQTWLQPYGTQGPLP